MLDRGQVEYMLQVAIDHGHQIDAELCRAWLALDAAPFGHVPVYSPGSSVGAVSVWFDEGVSADPISGQRVRLVATPASGGTSQ